ncbi:hypothetical protein KQX54_017546 [Cotesia glomerata]|uniref:Uncharacterized protein n=1 Tax=Cotesia glomerata TaxID=32391 RepID=A0AAV7IXQ9_COTGL|nr:hypothetical protein KQX54_017546 [Cotesia glomerata]
MRESRRCSGTTYKAVCCQEEEERQAQRRAYNTTSEDWPPQFPRKAPGQSEFALCQRLFSSERIRRQIARKNEKKRQFGKNLSLFGISCPGAIFWGWVGASKVVGAKRERYRRYRYPASNIQLRIRLSSRVLFSSNSRSLRYLTDLGNGIIEN